jgi:hypothetical protein
MSNTQFLFEKGIPAGIKRLVEPDQIMEIVTEASNDMLQDWGMVLARKADNLIKGKKTGLSRLFGGSDKILTSGLVSWVLYGKNKYGLSSEDWQYLELLKAVRALIPFKELPYDGSLGDIGGVSQKAIEESLKGLVEKTKSDLFGPMVEDYVRVIDSYSKNIEKLCRSSFGEDCSSGEGAEIFSGDLLVSVNMGIIRSAPGGLRVWRSFLPLVL